MKSLHRSKIDFIVYFFSRDIFSGSNDLFWDEDYISFILLLFIVFYELLREKKNY